MWVWWPGQESRSRKGSGTARGQPRITLSRALATCDEGHGEHLWESQPPPLHLQKAAWDSGV